MSHHSDDTLRAVEPPSGDQALDSAAQRCHAEALGALSPRTLSRLRASRQTAASSVPARQGFGWILAGGSAAFLALVIAVQLHDGAPPRQAAATATATGGKPAAAVAQDDYQGLVADLDENPDLYLWLAANHDALPWSDDR